MLYGRQDETVRLLDLLEDARQGRSAAIVVRGEPGAGKSALLDDLAANASEALVITGQGVETESELPFATLDQLLRPLQDVLEGLHPDQAAPLRGALGLGDGVHSDSYGVALSLLALLAEVGGDRPIVCLIDDAQWIDKVSEQTLVFVARRLLAEGVLMVFAARNEGFEPKGLDEMLLKPLDGATTFELLADKYGVTVQREVAERLTTETAGNPLAIMEVAGILTEAQLSGHELLPNPLPISSGIEQLFASQVEALPDATRRLLLIVAADDSGRPDIIFTAAQRLSLDVSSLDPAEKASLISVSPKEVRFRHPLIRSAIYGTAVFSERQAVHRALADVLKQAGEVDRYAWHLAAATLEPDPDVVRELVEAAARARGRNADAAASIALERAAELSPWVEERARLLVEAAGDAWMAGLLPQAERLIGAAQLLIDDPVLLANCYRLRGSVELASGSASTSTRRFIDAARQTAEVDPRRSLELLTLAGEGAWLALDPTLSLEVGQVAASLDLSTDDHDRFFAGLLVGFSSQFSDAGDSMRTIREAIATARDEHDDVDLMLAAGRAALYVGDDEAAERFNGRIVARARSIGSIGCLAIGGTRLAFAEILRGKWSSALATAEETARLAEDTGQEELAAHALVWRGLIAALRGDEDLCRDLIHEARAITTSRQMKLVDDAAMWAEGVLDFTLGRYEGALQKLQQVSHPVIAIAASLDRVEAAHQVDADDDARTWVDELEHFVHSSEAPWAAARLAHCRGLLADNPAEATAFFEQAILDHGRAPRPFERARTQLAFGSHLRRTRKRLLARTHLRAALETFESLGSIPWAERARTELRASGETARRRDPSTIDQLTSQELQVVRLVVRGMTNRQVASQLYVSPRTIDFHLRNVYSKLGISSRNQLATLDLAV